MSFKVTSIAITPPAAATGQPALTPELLASVLAKYSRSNEGLDTILSKVDLANPEASIQRILKFTDYGHASIGGLTGGIAIALDGVTMWMAYKLFEFSPHADGQESSTRYIPMDASSLPDWQALGFSPEDAAEINTLAQDGIDLYQREKARLDKYAEENPDAVRYPAGANDKAKARIRVNYGLDRARYFLPFAMKTNIALVQTARAWCDTISALLSMPQPEAQQVGAALKAELAKFAPNLVKHARRKPGHVDYHVGIESNARRFVDDPQVFGPRGCCVQGFWLPRSLESLKLRENRYDACRGDIKAATVRVAWSRMAVAELRDLNRHRTGHRFSTLTRRGFYIPHDLTSTVDGEEAAGELFRQFTEFARRVQKLHDTHINNPVTRPYTLFLGSQTDFTHVMPLDKFIYEAELRTGPGAHFRYAEHLLDAVTELEKLMPGQTCWIQLGEAEPE
jgi:thymidylate synthase ThyX